MNTFEMVVLVIGIVMLAGILKGRHRRDDHDAVVIDPDAARLREEVRMLKERIAVLERLATDENGARVLDREIEKLR